MNNTDPNTEFGLIDWIRQRAKALRSSHTKLPIGDDCAILDVTPHTSLLVTTDMLMCGATTAALVQALLRRGDPTDLRDAQAAIDRAIEIFGPAADYRAEEIPWDAAPLVRPNPLAPRKRP